jgi:hypothetical protein
MQYIVKPGDTLWNIARVLFGDPYRWRTIAEDNHLYNPNRLLVGQRLELREAFLIKGAPATAVVPMQLGVGPFEHLTSVIPGRAYLFVLADEVNPLRPKVVRKVMVNPAMAQTWSNRLGRPVPVMTNPERFGLHPSDPHSTLSLGRHAMGTKPSPYSSASTTILGSERITGSRFWIDVNRATDSGATLHGTADILTDLERIAKKTPKSADLVRIENIKRLVRGDSEVAIKGLVPASAIKGGTSMALTRGLQGVQLVGFVMTAVDVGSAIQRSAQQQSVKPVTAETIRQVGGWSMSWAGMQLGGLAGAAVGIETGPGAIATGFVGSLIGGVAGYMGCDWIADHIDEN